MFVKKPFFRKFNRYTRGPVIKANEYIRALQVQVIDESGNNLGVMETPKAVGIAQERGLDLVEISSKTEPPICKIIDKGKYQYLQEKKERKQKAKQRKAELKEIRIGFTTSSHDMGIKAKQAEKFLKEGDKVRLDIRLRGREKAFGNLAYEKMGKFLEMITVEYKKEDEIKKTPSGMGLTICQGKPKNQ
ncbi:MAG: translation initiation factor IF-3 [bacterium]|nr:translation initiation factor IF-3 [bacterium]